MPKSHSMTQAPSLPDTPTPPVDLAKEEEVLVFPTSFGQKRLWFLDQFEPGSPFYNIPMFLRIRGPLKPDVFDRAINEVIARHEALRTTFAVLDDEPVQVISPHLTITIPIEDISHLPEDEREQEAMRLAVQEARKPFNLANDPLLRDKLIRLGPDDHIILFTMHHIVSDGWSMGVLVGEIAALYTAFAQGQPSPLPDLSIQYADYALWQAEQIEGEELERQLDYWTEQLGGGLPMLELPTDRPRPAVQTSRGATTARHLDAKLTRGLKALAMSEGATLFMVLLAAFQTLLHRYTDQADISIGSPIANRTSSEVEGLIGLFINTLVFRTDLSGDPSFRELLRRLKEISLQAFDNQDLPFEQLVQVLQPERDMSHTPLFQAMFILQNAPVKAQPVGDLVFSNIDVDAGTATFDITLAMSEMAQGMDASVEYSTDLFDDSTIESMLNHFQVLLAGILADPDQTISRLPLLPQAELEQVVYGWNDTQVDVPLAWPVHRRFEQQVDVTPDAVAVVWQGRHLTYAELDKRANQLAHYLQNLGVGPETVVGVSSERSLDMIVALMGVLKAGGAYLPMDPNYPRERLAHMLTDSATPLVITQESVRSHLPEEHLTGRTVICIDEDWPDVAIQSDQRLTSAVPPDHLAYVIYTSGSTGQSKGVMVSHRSWLNAYHAWEDAYGLQTPGKSHLQMANFSFDVFSGDFVRALCSGGKLVLAPRDALLSAPDLYDLMLQEQISVAEFVPPVLRNLVQHLQSDGKDLAFIDVLICASDSWYAGEYRRFRRFCGPTTRLINSFGLTETTIDTTYFESDRLDLASEQGVPIGRPFANQQVYILDSRMQPVPIGVPGEIYIGGLGVARGYLNRSHLSAERFLPDPFSDQAGARMYRSGDRARFLSSGDIEFLGRVDSQVKIRGFRIEPGEVESALGKHPGLKETAVVVVTDPAGSNRIVAYVSPAHQPVPTASELRRYLLQRLPEYMVPSAFIVVDALPLTPNGKIDRRRLPEPQWDERISDREVMAPRTPVEEILAGVWQEVLGVSHLSVLDDFFELGGHSLLATQLMSRIRAAFDLELPLRNIFEFPTIATLAEAVEIAQRTETGVPIPPIIPLPHDGPQPVSFAQQRLWFLDQLEPNSPYYNIPEGMRVQGPLDLNVLERSLNEVVRRHASLRTTFGTVEGRPVQIIRPRLKLKIPVCDLSYISVDDREAEAMLRAREEARMPFTLDQGPLLRMQVLRFDPGDHVILTTMHHIIGDEWSNNNFIQEIAVLYDAFSHDRPSPLPDLPIQYVDFAKWQREWLEGEVLEAELNYWREQLVGASALLELPTDRPRPPIQTYAGDYKTFDLSPSLSASVKQMCRQEGVTLFMALMAAFKVLLHRYSGQNDISVGTPIANRSRAELEPLIGFFINTLVLRTDLDGDPTFREILQRVRDVALGAYAHQDIPFEMLVDAVQPTRDLSHSPLFQVMFVIQNASPGESQVMSDLMLQPLEAHSGTAKFDLTLFMLDEADALSGAWEYNTDLFDHATIERMMAHFQNLLAAAIANPDAPVTRLPMLADEEQRYLLVDWNQTASPFPDQLCVHDLVTMQVQRTPGAVAVSDGQETLTYAELDRRANQLANFLQVRGSGPESLVGVLAKRSAQVVVALLGVLKAGAAYVPIDPTYPRERIAYILADAGIDTLLTQAEFADELSAECEASVVSLDADWPQIARQPEGAPQTAVTPENLAYVIYTSGSTGRPKGTMLQHRGVVNYLTWCQQAYPLDKGIGSPVHSSISFDLTVTSMFSPLISGGLVQLVPEEQELDGLVNALLESDGFSLVKLTPAHLELLSQQMPEKRAAGRSHAFIIGGEALMPGHIAFWQVNAPETLLINEYGPTETVVGCCVYTAPADARLLSSVPIGRPVLNTQLYVLNEHFQPVPIGVPGELFIAGQGVGRGYLQRPGLTAGKFIPDPFSAIPGARMYRSGDLVRHLHDGNLEFMGRLDYQVKVRGFRIELGEIEAQLAQNELVKDCVVLAREDTPGQKRLVAYITPAEGGELDVTKLHQSLQEILPEYMQPAAYVVLDRLPLTPNGKVDREALPAAELTRDKLDSVYAAPSSVTEQVLTGIWAQLLVVDSDQIGVHDNFFELGGHSLLATQAVSRIKETFSIDLPLHLIFEAATVAGLAEHIDEVRLGGVRIQAPPIKPAPRDMSLPLSFAQQRLWFLDQLDSGNVIYNMPTAVGMSGALDLDALIHALNEIVRRHDTLRTRIVTKKGRASQVIDPFDPFALSIIDLSHLSPDDREHEAQRLVEEEAQAPFNLAQGPLFRARLIKLVEGDASSGREDDYILLLTLHHIISDGWSMRVLVQELTLQYIAYTGNLPSRLPELPIQYADFAYWQRQWLQGEVLESQLNYWREQLAGAPALLDLPTDHPRPPVQTHRGADLFFRFPDALTAALRNLSQQEGVTLFMSLLAAFQTLLHRYTHQTDICVGTPIANRSRIELENLIGFFVNTLVMRTDLTGSPSFRELLQRVREVALGAYDHQDLPFEYLVDRLGVERDMGHSPLFQVMFTLDSAASSGELATSDLSIRSFDSETTTARFDLVLSMIEDGDMLVGAMEYNTDLFEHSTIQRMVDHFLNLLTDVTTRPDTSVDRLNILSEFEIEQLFAWNQTGVPIPLHEPVFRRIEHYALERPDAVAVRFVGQEIAELSYAELNRQANQLAHYLLEMGVEPDTPVGISVQRSPDMVVGLLGIMKAGAAYMPIDPSYPIERIRYMIEDSGILVLLTDRAPEVKHYASHNAEYVLLDNPAISTRPMTNPDVFVSADHLAYVIYTSGSTGLPKGVMLQHRGLSNLVHAQTQGFAVEESSRVLQFASFSFDASVSETFMALYTGATLVLIPHEELISVSDMLDPLRQECITTVTLPPSLLAVLEPDDLPDMQTIISAGEPCTWDIVSRWQPGRRFINAYGPTEATVGPTYAVIDHEQEQTVTVPIGQPIHNVQIHLLSTVQEPVPAGITGEIFIGGECVGRGYLHRPALTSEKFIPDPFSDHPGARMYRTGDAGRILADGRIEFLGRLDDQVKVRGYRIELGEIEAVLEQHPLVQSAAVVIPEDGRSKRLVAYIIAAGDEAPQSEELRAFVQTLLPQYMTPSSFEIVDAFPLTPNGKVDRKALVAEELGRAEHMQAYVAPSSDTERILAQVWQDVMRIEQVGIHDNFFELGGDSILSIQVIAKTQDQGLRLDPRHIFQYPTIAELADVAQTSQIHAEQGLVAGYAPLTPWQQRFFEMELPEPQQRNHVLLIELLQTPPPNVLEAALYEIVRHHDALRLRFERQEDGWVQRNAEDESATIFSTIDLSSIPLAEQTDAITAHATGLRANMNLTTGPLLRSAYFNLGSERSARFLLVIHDLIIDSHSWSILLQDFLVAVRMLERGDSAQLSPKTTSFRHWSQYLQVYAQSETVREELGYWLDTLSQPEAFLPFDFVGIMTAYEEHVRIVRTLTQDETKALVDDALMAYNTEPHDLLLTTLCQVFIQRSDAASFLVDIEDDQRWDAIVDGVDVARTVGRFTFAYPVALTLENSDHLDEAIKSIKEQLRSIPQNGLGYGLLRYLNEDAEVRAQLQSRPPVSVAFRLRKSPSDALVDIPAVRLAPESSGSTHNLKGEQTHLVEVEAVIRDGCLQVEWHYDHRRYRSSTIEALADEYMYTLRALIEHCLSPDAGGFTESDVAEFGWDETDLQDFEDAFSQLGDF